MLIFRVIDALSEQKIPYALVGGYAVALHGAVRGTVDIDLVLQIIKSDFVRFENLMHQLGLESRIPVHAEQVYAFREEYIREKNLIAWSFYNPIKPIEVVDVIITEDLRKMKTTTIQAHRKSIRVATIEELIKMKEKSGRPQDLEDVRALTEILELRRKKKAKK